jgi:hypothetical protein
VGPLAVVLVQAVLVAESARRLERRIGGRERPLALRWLAVQVLALAQVVAALLALGYAGQLRTPAILLVHLAIVAGVAGLDRRRPAPSPAAPLGRSTATAFRAWPSRDRWLAAGLAAVVLVLALTGVLGHHATHDALSYRLSRIGFWLQEGSIRHFPTNEPRHSYSPVNVDLVMVWLTHPFRLGFPLATLAQAWGGGLLLLSAWWLAGRAGLGRTSRLGVLALVLGMPSTLVQLMASQSDLLTAGLLWAGLALLLESLGEPRRAVPAWLAIAMAAGAKGTVFFAGPGLLLLVAAAPRARELTPRALGRHALCALACAAALAAPRYVENLLAWGDPFAPPGQYAAHQGEVAPATIGAKASLNAITYVAEAIDPSSNPAALAPGLRPAWEALVTRLPDADPFAGPVYPRRGSLLFFSRLPLRNADTLSTGAVVPLLALAGAVVVGSTALRRGWRPEERLAAGLGAFALVFGAVFSALFLWWPTNVRFFSLVAVPLAVLAARALQALPSPVRRPSWLLAVALGTAIGAEVYAGTVNAGWRVLGPPPRALLPWWGDHLAEIAVVQSLPPGSRLAAALPRNTVLAGLFRGGSDVRVLFVPLDDLAQESDGPSFLRSRGLDALLTTPGRAKGARPVLVPTGSSRPLVLHLPRP